MLPPPVKVAIGSTNPVKLKAVQLGFKKVWPKRHFNFQGVAVSSGVSDQPMSDKESIKGATNRAQKARLQLQAEYGVGLEGGLQQVGEHWFGCGWVVVVDHHGVTGIGSTARIIIPSAMFKLVQQGMELGQVVDHFFDTVNAKQGDGHFGLMTNKAITRTSGYTDGVIMSLVRFLHPEFF